MDIASPLEVWLQGPVEYTNIGMAMLPALYIQGHVIYFYTIISLCLW